MKQCLHIRFCTALRITWSRSCIRHRSRHTHGCCKWRRWKPSITSLTSAALTSPTSVSSLKCGVRSATWRTWGGHWRKAQWVKSFSSHASLILSILLTYEKQLRSFNVPSRPVTQSEISAETVASLKRIVHPKNDILLTMYSPSGHEFVSSSEQIWRNFALHHLLTNGSSAVNGCRQNESPNSW